MLRHTTLCAVLALIALTGTYAQAGDCDSLKGTQAYGLCNSYCEAKKCHTDTPNGSQNSCDQLYDNFMKVAPAGTDMPCEVSVSPSSQSGLCPCNFASQFWTSQTQILNASTPSMCPDGTFDNCMTCDIKSWFGAITLLGVTVNTWDQGVSSGEDTLFFVTTDPSSFFGGTCSVNALFSSGYTFEENGLPVTNEQFPACVSNIAALQETYTAMCSR